MAIKRKPMLFIAGALILTSFIGIAIYAKTKSDSDKKSRSSSSYDKSHKLQPNDKPLVDTKQPAKVSTPPLQTIPTPTAPITTVPALITHPGQLLRLTNWKLQLPIDTERTGSPDEIKQPELNSYTDANNFFLNSQLNGVVFRANAGGATTKNSSYPRSELREMTSDGRSNASWANNSGTHTMTVRQAITHLPDVKDELVAGQIHDDSDDVIMIRLEGAHLFVESGGKNIGDLATNYNLGTMFTIKMVAEQSSIKVYYNDSLKVTTDKNGSGYYFKAGCYTQANTTKGDSPASYGEVTIYDLSVSHT
jgi:hypothetical protein